MLTQESQIDVIVRRLAGLPLDREYTAEDFERILRVVWLDLDHRWETMSWEPGHSWYIVENFVDSRARQLLRLPYLQLMDHRMAIEQDEAPEEPKRRRFASLAEIGPTLQPVRWLWKGWLPRGMMTVLAARPGVGKSLVALDFTRMIISGRAWPDGSPQSEPGRVCIYVDAENIPAVMNERATLWEQWGMDRSKIYPLLAAGDDAMIDLSSEKYRDQLWEMCDELQPALVVIDSLRDILPGGERGIEDVRATLKFLTEIASVYDCAVLTVHHLRKRSGGQLALPVVDLDDVSGSGYITGHARVVQGLVKLRTGGDKNGPRKLEIVKTNLSAYPPDLGIEFEQVPPEGLRLVYGSVADAYEEDTGGETVADWLLEYLEENGPSKPKEIVEAGQAAGFSRTMIYAARSQLGERVQDTEKPRHPANMWVAQ